jgi:hypothetical protein
MVGCTSNPVQPQINEPKMAEATIPSTNATQSDDVIEKIIENPHPCAIVIDGFECYLGMKFSDVLAHFETDGLDFDGNPIGLVNPKYRAFLTITTKNDQCFYVTVYNNTDNPTSYENCILEEIDCNIDFIQDIELMTCDKSLSFNSSAEDFMNILGKKIPDGFGDELLMYGWMLRDDNAGMNILIGVVVQSETLQTSNIKIVYDR